MVVLFTVVVNETITEIVQRKADAHAHKANVSQEVQESHLTMEFSYTKPELSFFFTEQRRLKDIAVKSYS